jgi:hypothetical protein
MSNAAIGSITKFICSSFCLSNLLPLHFSLGSFLDYQYHFPQIHFRYFLLKHTIALEIKNRSK